jgi:hypothetical protein
VAGTSAQAESKAGMFTGAHGWFREAGQCQDVFPRSGLDHVCSGENQPKVRKWLPHLKSVVYSASLSVPDEDLYLGHVD